MHALFNTLKLQLRLWNRQRLRRRLAAKGPGYAEWVAEHDTLGEAEHVALAQRLAGLQARGATPTIAVLMPVYNPPPALLREAIASVQAQLYPHWQLCIADDASTDPAVRAVLAEASAADARIQVVYRPQNGHICAASNSALALVQAPWVALLDHDDVLRPHALLLVAEAAARFPQAQLIYSDEDKLDITGQRHDPYFKPDWNPTLALSQHFSGHLSVYATARVQALGGFRPGFEGSQDHDLALRFTEGLASGQVVHIPHVLYHWRQHDGSTAGQGAAKPYTLVAGEKAVAEALQRRGLGGEVQADEFGWYRVTLAPLQPPPSVTLVVPTRDGLNTLPRLVDSLARTAGPAFELLVVDNGSVDAGFLAYLHRLAQRPHTRVQRDDRPFNYSALNNAAVAQCNSEFVLLLNDDTEVLSPDWLQQMLGWAAQPGVGAVGARLWYADMTLQHAGLVLGVGSVAGHAHRHLPQGQPGQRGRAALLQGFSAVTAAALCVRRSHYLAVGGLDEADLAVAFNDVDFCLKLQAAGLQNLWVPQAELKHHESATRGSDREASRRARCEREAAVMQQRWGATLAADPAYNPNLTLAHEDFSLARPPRVNLCQPWFETPLGPSGPPGTAG